MWNVDFYRSPEVKVTQNQKWPPPWTYWLSIKQFLFHLVLQKFKLSDHKMFSLWNPQRFDFPLHNNGRNTELFSWFFNGIQLPKLQCLQLYFEFHCVSVLFFICKCLVLSLFFLSLSFPSCSLPLSLPITLSCDISLSPHTTFITITRVLHLHKHETLSRWSQRECHLLSDSLVWSHILYEYILDTLSAPAAGSKQMWLWARASPIWAPWSTMRGTASNLEMNGGLNKPWIQAALIIARTQEHGSWEQYPRPEVTVHAGPGGMRHEGTQS